MDWTLEQGYCGAVWHFLIHFKASKQTNIFSIQDSVFIGTQIPMETKFVLRFMLMSRNKEEKEIEIEMNGFNIESYERSSRNLMPTMGKLLL